MDSNELWQGDFAGLLSRLRPQDPGAGGLHEETAGWDRIRAAWELGYGEEALTAAAGLRDHFAAGRDRRSLARAYLWLARVMAGYGDPQSARIPFDKAGHILSTEGDASDRRWLDLVRYELLADPGGTAAEALLEACARDVVEGTGPWWSAWVTTERAFRQWERGDSETARVTAAACLHRLESDEGEPCAPELRWRLHALLASSEADPAGEEAGRHRDASEEIRRWIRAVLPAEAQVGYFARRDRARWSALAASRVEPPAPDRPGAGRDLRAVSRVIRAMASETRQDILLDLIVDTLVEASGADSGFLILAGGDAESPAVRRAAGKRGLPAADLSWSTRIAREVLTTGRTVLLGDAMSAAAWKDHSSIHEQGLRSILCVPLRYGRRVLGTVFLDSRSRTNQFGAAEQDLAEILADHAAVALETADLVRRCVTDPLTSASTHAYFEQQLAHALECTKRRGGHCSLLLIDLDRFKEVNDTHGHDCGSRLLRHVAEVLRATVRASDFTARARVSGPLLGRYGGDEFEVLLPQTEPATLAAIGQRILTAFEQTPYVHAGGRMEIRASVGGATFPDDASDAESLFLCADQALYTAKRTGRHRFTAHGKTARNASQDSAADDRLSARYGPDVVTLLSQLVALEQDDQTMLDATLQAVVRVTDAERGFVVLLGEADRIRLHSAFGIDHEQLAADRFRLSFGVVEQVLRDGESLRVSDAASDGRFSDRESVRDLRLRSVLAVPIPGEGRPLGAIYLDSSSSATAFSGEDEDLLRRFAELLARALRTGRNTRVQSHRLTCVEQALAAAVKDLQARYRFDALIGDGAAMRSVRTVLDHVVRFPYPVLILGETGTGKEMVARAIHANGDRRDHPMVAVNCAALSRELLESELFGHVKGSFTGADQDRPGLFRAADGGTLLLDEVGEMPEDLQRKLLRVLQEGEFLPVGATRPVRCNVRILAATHRDLEQEVREGRFREDLFYRLKVFSVRLPSLRERAEDIPGLARHLLDKVLRETGAGDRTLTPEAIDALVGCPWPGNVRQLENALRHAVAFSTSEIRAAHLPADPIRPPAPRPAAPGARTTAAPDAELVGRYPRGSVGDVWKSLILQTLEACGGNQSLAARELGISRSTLYRKLRAYGVRMTPQPDGPLSAPDGQK